MEMFEKRGGGEDWGCIRRVETTEREKRYSIYVCTNFNLPASPRKNTTHGHTHTHTTHIYIRTHPYYKKKLKVT